MSDWHYGNHCHHHSLWIWKIFLKKTQKLSPNAFILCYYTLLLPLVPIFIEILSIYCLGGAIGKVREYATLLYRFCIYLIAKQAASRLVRICYLVLARLLGTVAEKTNWTRCCIKSENPLLLCENFRLKNDWYLIWKP